MKALTKHKNVQCIYKIVNISNGKIYVGGTGDLYKRIIQHKSCLNKSSKDANRKLLIDWIQYGIQNFDYFVLEIIINKSDLKQREDYWITKLNSTIDGYNLRRDTALGMVSSVETKTLYSIAQKKRFTEMSEDQLKSHGLKTSTFWKSNPETLLNMTTKVSKGRIYNIEQYDKDGNFIRRWESPAEIIKENPSYKRNNIYAVCSGEKPSIYGYVWKKVLKKI